MDLENKLQDCINELKKCNRIIGTPLTLEEMLNLVEEREIGLSLYIFEGGDEEIISCVQQEMAIERGDITHPIEVDSDDSEDDEPLAKQKTASEVMKMCEEMEQLCLKFGPLTIPWISQDTCASSASIWHRRQ